MITGPNYCIVSIVNLNVNFKSRDRLENLPEQDKYELYDKTGIRKDKLKAPRSPVL
ncbi:hypothetical protein LAD12857_41040 [Lacrimispora amygdalina]|uniref:Transposase n=1 Tax=Lacrimispora amygdalina TaxID=253257 RepID=A0ABQ5MBI9_9FIRM